MAWRHLCLSVCVFSVAVTAVSVTCPVEESTGGAFVDGHTFRVRVSDWCSVSWSIDNTNPNFPRVSFTGEIENPGFDAWTSVNIGTTPTSNLCPHADKSCASFRFSVYGIEPASVNAGSDFFFGSVTPEPGTVWWLGFRLLSGTGPRGWASADYNPFVLTTAFHVNGLFDANYPVDVLTTPPPEPFDFAVTRRDIGSTSYVSGAASANEIVSSVDVWQWFQSRESLGDSFLTIGCALGADGTGTHADPPPLLNYTHARVLLPTPQSSLVDPCAGLPTTKLVLSSDDETDRVVSLEWSPRLLSGSVMFTVTATNQTEPIWISVCFLRRDPNTGIRIGNGGGAAGVVMQDCERITDPLSDANGEATMGPVFMIKTFDDVSVPTEFQGTLTKSASSISPLGTAGVTRITDALVSETASGLVTWEFTVLDYPDVSSSGSPTGFSFIWAISRSPAIPTDWETNSAAFLPTHTEYGGAYLEGWESDAPSPIPFIFGENAFAILPATPAAVENPATDPSLPADFCRYCNALDGDCFFNEQTLQIALFHYFVRICWRVVIEDNRLDVEMTALNVGPSTMGICVNDHGYMNNTNGCVTAGSPISAAERVDPLRQYLDIQIWDIPKECYDSDCLVQRDLGDSSTGIMDTVLKSEQFPDAGFGEIDGTLSLAFSVKRDDIDLVSTSARTFFVWFLKTDSSITNREEFPDDLVHEISFHGSDDHSTGGYGYLNTNLLTGDMPSTGLKLFEIVHASLIMGGLAILLLGIYYARYTDYRREVYPGRNWLQLHELIGSAGVLFLITGAYIGVMLVPIDAQLTEVHHWVGVIVAGVILIGFMFSVISCCQPWDGQEVETKQLKVLHNGVLQPVWNAIHISTLTIPLLAMPYVMWTGLSIGNASLAWYIAIVLYFLGIIGLVFVMEIRRTMSDPMIL